VSARVRVVVWGVTDEDAAAAIQAMSERPAASRWVFDTVERAAGALCPIDVAAPGLVAAQVGARWVYAVYPAPLPLARVYYVDRAGITGDFVSEADARALFEEYRGTEGFDGDLETRFVFYPGRMDLALAPPVSLRGPAVRVHLVPEHEVPDEVRRRLGAGAAEDASARAS